MKADLKYIDLSDFRAGIVHNLGYASEGGALKGFGPGGQGMASMDGTYRCFAMPNGGLAPLPKRDWSMSVLSPGGGAKAWYVQTGIIGPIFAISPPLGSLQPSFASIFNARDFSSHPIEVWLGMESNDGTTRRQRTYRARVYEFNRLLDTAAKRVQVSSTDITGNNASLQSPFTSPTWFASGRFVLHGSDPTLSEPTPLMWASWRSLTTDGGIRASATSQFLVGFPDLSTSGLETNASLNYGRLLAHQSRLLVIDSHSVGWTLSPSVDSNDGIGSTNWWWSSPAVADTLDSPGYPQLVFDEFAQTYGVLASLTASDLLVITHDVGGYLIQGDLNDPTVRKLPNVTPTYGAECVPANTPIGLVYGSNVGGVHAWGGGDGSQQLAPQLSPDFWMHPDSNMVLNYRGRFAFFDHFVLVPNGWVLDINTNGWFRFDDPDEFAPYEWHVNPVNGYIYGNEPKWTDPGGTALLEGYFRGYNPSVGAHSYSWRSQPIFLSQDRMVIARDLVLMVQGSGTVTVYLEDDYGGAQVYTLTLTSRGLTAPEMLGRPIDARTQGQLRIRIIARGTGSDGVAPVVYACRVGYNEAQQATPSEQGVQYSGYGSGVYGGAPTYGS